MQNIESSLRKKIKPELLKNSFEYLLLFTLGAITPIIITNSANAISAYCDCDYDSLIYINTVIVFSSLMIPVNRYIKKQMFNRIIQRETVIDPKLYLYIKIAHFLGIIAGISLPI